MTSGRGILYPSRLPSFARYDAPDRVADLVRWFWIPEWDLGPGRTSRQHLIAFPACNLVVEPRLVGLSGPSSRASHRDLEGAGWAVGALLRPAAAAHLVEDPTAIRDRYVVLARPGQHAGDARLEALLHAVARAMEPGETSERHGAAVAAYADWLVREVTPPDELALLANRMAEVIETDPDVVRVDDVADRLHVSARTVQRLAHRYVGLSPAAMIRRRRLQEAVELVRRDPSTDLSTLAAQLGYSDHAHLTGEFRSVLGFTPSGYRRSV